MPGLVPGIHVLFYRGKSWMAGTSPAMTIQLGFSGRYTLRARSR
jgi:hypothetical protein